MLLTPDPIFQPILLQIELTIVCCLSEFVLILLLTLDPIFQSILSQIELAFNSMLSSMVYISQP